MITILTSVPQGSAVCNLALEGSISARLIFVFSEVQCVWCNVMTVPSANMANQLTLRDSLCLSLFSSDGGYWQCHSVKWPLPRVHGAFVNGCGSLLSGLIYAVTRHTVMVWKLTQHQGSAQGGGWGLWGLHSCHCLGSLEANLVLTLAAEGAREQRLCGVGGTGRSANKRRGVFQISLEVPIRCGYFVIVSIVHWPHHRWHGLGASTGNKVYPKAEIL